MTYAPSNFTQGLQDLIEGAKLYNIWWNLAVFEVRTRYKRTKLGPFWITLSTLVLLLAMGPLYARLFNQELGTYYLYLSCGFIFWNHLVTTVMDMARALPESRAMLLSYGFPISVYIFKTLCRNIIILLHNLIIIAVILLFFSDKIGIHAFGLLIGYALFAANLFSSGIIVALISTRFRDIEQIISSVLTIMFFLTPILWDPNLLGDRKALLYFNPFYSFLKGVRAPLIDDIIPYDALMILTGLLLASMPLALYLLGRLRHRVALWV